MKRARVAAMVGVVLLMMSAIPARADESVVLSGGSGVEIEQMTLAPSGQISTLILLAALLLMTAAATVDVLAAEIARHRAHTAWSSEPLSLNLGTHCDSSR